MAKFFTLLALLGLALLSLAHAKDLFAAAGPNSVAGKDDVLDDNNNYNNAIFEEFLGDDLDDLNDDELDDVVENLVGGSVEDEVVDELDDFPVEDLDDDGLKELVKAEDEILVGQLDVHIAKQLYLENKAVTSQSGQGRRKRIAPLIGRAAWIVGRALFNRYGRTHVTRSGARLTQHYRGTGNYQSAVRDFERMRPTGVTSFNNGRIAGRTGQVGNYRVTVRDGSTKGTSRPTLSVQRNGRSDFVRKFRYDNP